MQYPISFPVMGTFLIDGRARFVNIDMHYDFTTGTYIALSKEVPGLVIEAYSLDEMNEQLVLQIPQILSKDKDKNKGARTADLPLMGFSDSLH